MSTSNLTPSERRRLGYGDMVLQDARRNKRADEQCYRSSSEDYEGNGIEDDKEDIMNELGNTSRSEQRILLIVTVKSMSSMKSNDR